MKKEIITPTVTLFNEKGDIDLNSNTILLENLIENKIDGVVPLGSSGEFTNFTMYEKKKIIDLNINIIKDRISIMPNITCEKIQDTIELGKYLEGKNIRGVLLLVPYYYAISQDEAYKYYSYISSKLDLNIYIYNFFNRTGFDISCDTILKLLKNNKNIIGIKDSTSNVQHTKDIITKVKYKYEKFEVFSGFDNHFFENCILGGNGCIAAISNIIPKVWSNYVKYFNENNYEKIKSYAIEFEKMVNIYNFESNFPLLFKELIKKNFTDINTYTKFPFDTINTENIDKAYEVIKCSLKILKEV